jgi:hypothetical protein
MSIISKLPKKVNEWLVTGQKLGLLTEKQKNDFIAKYISLRQAGRPEVQHRKPKGVTLDKLDNAMIDVSNNNRPFTHSEMVANLTRSTGILQITPEKVYHRLQKLVELGVYEKVSMEGSKQVLYAKKNIPLNKS